MPHDPTKEDPSLGAPQADSMYGAGQDVDGCPEHLHRTLLRVNLASVSSQVGLGGFDSRHQRRYISTGNQYLLNLQAWSRALNELETFSRHAHTFTHTRNTAHTQHRGLVSKHSQAANCIPTSHDREGLCVQRGTTCGSGDEDCRLFACCSDEKTSRQYIDSRNGL